jgi:hypothetical protein
VAGSCVYGDEPSGSIKCREFLDCMCSEKTHRLISVEQGLGQCCIGSEALSALCLGAPVICLSGMLKVLSGACLQAVSLQTCTTQHEQRNTGQC